MVKLIWKGNVTDRLANGIQTAVTAGHLEVTCTSQVWSTGSS